MKHLILIHGPMGVGKTTVCRQLAMLLQPNVFLDGDWCWQMQPFVPNEENKQMALRHMIYLLNSFLDNRNFSYVLFSWVIPDEKIFQKILKFYYIATKRQAYNIGDIFLSSIFLPLIFKASS